MHRVYFDSNDGTKYSGFLLWFDQSLHDLEAIGDELHEGLRVLLYMPDELEVEAILRFDQESDCWLGVPAEGERFKLIGRALEFEREHELALAADADINRRDGSE